MSKKQAENLESWIRDTQMFQRIAKVEESTREELITEWSTFSKANKAYAATHAETNLIILKVADSIKE